MIKPCTYFYIGYCHYYCMNHHYHDSVHLPRMLPFALRIIEAKGFHTLSLIMIHTYICINSISSSSKIQHQSVQSNVCEELLELMVHCNLSFQSLSNHFTSVYAELSKSKVHNIIFTCTFNHDTDLCQPGGVPIPRACSTSQYTTGPNSF